MADVYKVLSRAVLVDRQAFNALPAANLPGMLAEMQWHGKPLSFRDDVITLMHTPTILEKLSKGEDVSLELELIGVNLSEEEERAISIYLSVLEKIRSFVPPYPFAPKPDNWQQKIKKVNDRTVNNGSYNMGLKTAMRVWTTARDYWKKASQIRSMSVQADGYSRNVTIYNDHVQIGCQNISRCDIEQFALEQGWPFV